MFCDDLEGEGWRNGREAQERGDISILIAESWLLYTRTLQSNYNFKNKLKKNFKMVSQVQGSVHCIQV